MNSEQAYDFCESIIRNNSRSFYAAYKGLPIRKRQAVFAVYAFCRKVDDSIDSHHDLKELEIYDHWLDQIAQDIELDDPVYVALKDTIRHYQIGLKPFRDMIIGQRMDVQFTQPKDEAALLDYCYHVASTVGLMLLPILAEKEHDSLNQTAMVLGYAMQITNILRDVGEDAKMNRIYLPVEDLNISVLSAIETGRVNPEFIALWEKWAHKAEVYYEEASSQIHRFDEDSRLPLMQSLVYYKAILNTVRQADYDCLTKRQSVKDFLGLKSEISRRLRKGHTHE